LTFLVFFPLLLLSQEETTIEIIAIITKNTLISADLFFG